MKITLELYIQILKVRYNIIKDMGFYQRIV